MSDHISNAKLHELGVKQCPGCFKPQQVTIADEVRRAAEDTYRETLTELRLNERGPFKGGSHHRRALHAALEAAQAVLRERERELLTLKGPCSNRSCELHHAHSGPCA